MALRILFVSMAALLAGSFIDYARADVGYVCDGNVVVMVARGELERMKRENACVASHHPHETAGKAADTAVATHVGSAPRALQAASTQGPAPVARSSAEAASSAAAGLRGVQPAEEAPSRLMMFASGHVRIINAAPRTTD